MQPAPTGRVLRTGPYAYDLILTRSFPESAQALWPGLTDPAQTARWIGRWEGTAFQGRTIGLQLLYEDGEPISQTRITECTAPEHLQLLVEDEYGRWDLELYLREILGGTQLDFIHHLEDPAAAEGIGPGWEYYLDRLVATRSGMQPPDFADYYPAQGPYFTAQAQAAQSTGAF